MATSVRWLTTKRIAAGAGVVAAAAAALAYLSPHDPKSAAVTEVRHGAVNWSVVHSARQGPVEARTSMGDVNVGSVSSTNQSGGTTAAVVTLDAKDAR